MSFARVRQSVPIVVQRSLIIGLLLSGLLLGVNGTDEERTRDQSVGSSFLGANTFVRKLRYEVDTGNKMLIEEGGRLIANRVAEFINVPEGTVDPEMNYLFESTDKTLILGPPIGDHAVYRLENITGRGKILFGVVRPRFVQDDPTIVDDMHGHFIELRRDEKNTSYQLDVFSVHDNFQRALHVVQIYDSDGKILKEVETDDVPPAINNRKGTNDAAVLYQSMVAFEQEASKVSMYRVLGFSTLISEVDESDKDITGLRYVDLTAKEAADTADTVLKFRNVLPDGFAYQIPLDITRTPGVYEFVLYTDSTETRVAMGVGRLTNTLVASRNIIEGFFFDGFSIRNDYETYKYWIPMTNLPIRMRVNVSVLRGQLVLDTTFWQHDLNRHSTQLYRFNQLFPHPSKNLQPFVVVAGAVTNLRVERVAPSDADEIMFADVQEYCLENEFCRSGLCHQGMRGEVGACAAYQEGIHFFDYQRSTASHVIFLIFLHTSMFVIGWLMMKYRNTWLHNKDTEKKLDRETSRTNFIS